MDQQKTIYKVSIKKETTYCIKAESEEQAIEKAEEWFDEMYPDIETEAVSESDFTGLQHLMGAYAEI